MAEGLNHWGFVLAAYVLGVLGTGGLVLHSWLAMRAAEHRRERARGQ